MKPNVKQLIERIQSELPRLGNKKPDLADVLEWLNEKMFTTCLELCIKSDSLNLLRISCLYFFCNWNLSEPIENQSDEMINFLLEI